MNKAMKMKTNQDRSGRAEQPAGTTATTQGRHRTCFAKAGGCGRGGWLLGVATLGLAMGVGAPLMAQETDTREQVNTTREAMARWVETRKVISQEQRDMLLGREVMNERIELVKREIETIRQRIKDAQQSITDADKRREELVQQNEQLKASAAALAANVGELESRTLKLLAQLPDPIRERVKPLSQRIPASGTAATEIKLSLGERYQNVVGILNEVNKFNREITLTSEVRPLPDGSSAEVAAVYLGVGQGYYVSANGNLAGYGRPKTEGWTWTADNAIAPQVSLMLAIMKNEQVASFVRLPIEIPQTK